MAMKMASPRTDVTMAELTIIKTVLTPEKPCEKGGITVEAGSDASSKRSTDPKDGAVITCDIEKATGKPSAAHQKSSGSTARTSLRQQLPSFVDTLRLVVFSTYRQLFAILCVVNFAGIVGVAVRFANTSAPPLKGMTTAAVSNITVAILIRQDYIKNLLYRLCWSTPHSAPLWLRKRLALIYELGGVHSGGTLCGVGWFLVFVGFLTKEFVQGNVTDRAVLGMAYALLSILLAITVTALPQMRRRYHNLFENVHRLGGWATIILFWPAIVLFAQDSANAASIPLGSTLTHLPAFWLLIILSCHTIYPWLLLRKVPVHKVEHLSDHAVRIYFSPKEKIRPLHGLAISDSVLSEWHAFAAIPDLDGSDDGATSCIISRAGDWTAKTIAKPAEYYYMRGVHATGVLAMAQIFTRVVVMTTGSGIGPCMALFGLCPNTQIRVIWSTPSPESIFGEKIIKRVLQQDPQATIWDTRKGGQRRPDLIQMSFDLYQEIDAEAVWFISNRRLTRKVIDGLRKRGVPAYAPVFDS